jgi:hypothetical protein
MSNLSEIKTVLVKTPCSALLLMSAVVGLHQRFEACERGRRLSPFDPLAFGSDRRFVAICPSKFERRRLDFSRGEGACDANKPSHRSGPNAC